MVDNERRKVVDCQDNAILIEPCTAQTLGRGDVTLEKLADYIDLITATCKTDIRA